jgi:hypothetical protein
MPDIRASLLLSVQRALLGAVPGSLRAVTCHWEETEIKLRFVFDGEIDDDDYEAAGIVGSEVIADFPAPWTICEDIVRVDYPGSLCSQPVVLWAYRRKEE